MKSTSPKSKNTNSNVSQISSSEKPSRARSETELIRVIRNTITIYDTDKEFLNTKEAASLMGVGVSTLKASRLGGMLLNRPAPKHIPTGERNYLYPRVNCVAWITAISERRISGGSKQEAASQ